MEETKQPSATAQKEMSFGEKAVGMTFNPGGHPLVNSINRLAADYIDHLNNARNFTTDNEVKRMLSVAITEAQTSQMWAVKAVTWNA